MLTNAGADVDMQDTVGVYSIEYCETRMSYGCVCVPSSFYRSAATVSPSGCSLLSMLRERVRYAISLSVLNHFVVPFSPSPSPTRHVYMVVCVVSNRSVAVRVLL